eukprot:XP_001707279.1 Hypothetical protein GL50803_21955 [Giardia lamblia ATCC 50803]
MHFLCSSQLQVFYPDPFQTETEVDNSKQNKNSNDYKYSDVNH